MVMVLTGYKVDGSIGSTREYQKLGSIKGKELWAVNIHHLQSVLHFPACQSIAPSHAL